MQTNCVNDSKNSLSCSEAQQQFVCKYLTDCSICGYTVCTNNYIGKLKHEIPKHIIYDIYVHVCVHVCAHMCIYVQTGMHTDKQSRYSHACKKILITYEHIFKTTSKVTDLISWSMFPHRDIGVGKGLHLDYLKTIEATIDSCQPISAVFAVLKSCLINSYA